MLYLVSHLQELVVGVGKKVTPNPIFFCWFGNHLLFLMGQQSSGAV